MTKDFDPNHRQWERTPYSRRLLLTFADQRQFEGVSADVSLNGVFLKITKGTNTIAEGEKGELHLISDQENLIFPCHVVRVTSAGIAVQLDKKQALFGLYLTQELFANVQQNRSKEHYRHKTLPHLPKNK